MLHGIFFFCVMFALKGYKDIKCYFENLIAFINFVFNEPENIQYMKLVLRKLKKRIEDDKFKRKSFHTYMNIHEPLVMCIFLKT